VDNFGTTSASNNTIGGTSAAARNIISGNHGNGVTIEGLRANGNFVQGNYIGTNITGTAAVANGTGGTLPTGAGVKILSANNTIGGTTAGARNVISGNSADGVQTSGAATSGNVIRGNYIGTNINGTASVPNVGSGLSLAAGTNTTVGGTGGGEGNVIAFNTKA